MSTILKAVDLSVSQATQSFQPDWLTSIMQFVSALLAPAILVVISLILVFLYTRHYPHKLAKTSIIITFGYVLIPILKSIVNRPRPDPVIVHVLTSTSDPSFPSGHAMGIVLLAGVIGLFLKYTNHRLANHFFIAIGIVVLAVGYSRIYLGVHWLTDVIAGYAIGLGWVWFAWRVSSTWLSKLLTSVIQGNKKL